MGIFDQLKMASSMFKNMSPEQIQELMARAKDSQRLLEEQIKKVVDEEIKKRGLVSREEVEKMIGK